MWEANSPLKEACIHCSNGDHVSSGEAVSTPLRVDDNPHRMVYRDHGDLLSSGAGILSRVADMIDVCRPFSCREVNTHDLEV